MSTENLIQHFADDYFEKLYYFCLKKTSNANEAEDLTQETAVAVIHELRKGTVPNNFPAWVWQIARNKYALWADRKNKRNNTLSGGGIDDGVLEIADIENGVDDDLLLQEDYNLLRRELAFISS